MRSSATSPRTGTSPQVTADRIIFSLADPDRDLAAVRLYQELDRPRDGLIAIWDDGAWRVAMPRPDHEPDGALRMEYAFIVRTRSGDEAFITDPANPLLADGAFGAKSVVELPGYTRPAWVDRPPPADPGTTMWVDLPLPRFGAAMPCGIWQPPDIDADEPLPLLIAHDGPEYAELAGLLHVLALAIADERIPRMRAALLGPVPGRRDETYAASARYADALGLTAIGWLARTAPQPPGSRPVVMGASLGALAALHLAHRHPRLVGGLFLQSGSYFRQRTDPQERGYTHFDRISRVVGEILRSSRAAHPLPITLTCGTVEENLANNRVMAAALDAAGHDVVLITNRDGHTYPAWRDTFDPHLIDLLDRALGRVPGRDGAEEAAG